MRVDAARLEATIIAELRELFERYPGNDDFVLEMQTRTGLRRLRFGGDYRIAARNGALKSELRSLLGDAIVAQPPAEAVLAAARARAGRRLSEPFAACPVRYLHLSRRMSSSPLR